MDDRANLAHTVNADGQTNASALLVPDQAIAEQFFKAIATDASDIVFEYRCFDDNHDRQDESLVQCYSGTIQKIWPTLVRNNRHGAGGFFTVNKTEGGLSAEHVTEIRAVFADLDGSPLSAILNEKELPPPHIIVESSTGKYHVYWKITGLALEQFTPIQKMLSRRFNGDPKVCDKPRVMRVPGLVHQKIKNEFVVMPSVSRIIQINDVSPYAPDAFLKFVTQVDTAAETVAPYTGALRPDAELEADPDLVAAAVKWIPNDNPEWGWWNDKMMAIWRATRGSEQGFEIAKTWSEKWPGFNLKHTIDRWKTIGKSPPNRIGAGTLFRLANAANPNWRDEYEAEQRQQIYELLAARINGQKPMASASPATPPPATPAASAAKIEFLDMSSWDDCDPPPRRWAVRNRIPLGQPALLSGEGGAGKTILLLQLCVATALERDWISSLPEPGRVIYLGAEDDGDELHRRLADIVDHYDAIKSAKFSDLRDRLFVTSYAGRDATLARFDRNGLMQVTPLYRSLLEQACDIRPTIIGLDTVSDIFAGNENDRTQVSAFLGLLRGMAMASSSAVIINSHPSLSGISSGSGLSGTTAWHNRVRSRMYFKPATTNEQGEDSDPDLRVLEFRKNNYGPSNESILLRWRGGVFVPEPTEGSVEKQIADKRMDDLFMGLLARFSHEGRNVSDKTGTSYAPAKFAGEPEAKAIKASRKSLEEAMRRLFLTGKIRVVTEGPVSHRRTRLMIVGGVS